MGDSTVPLRLGFVKESEKQPMEIEGGGSGSEDALGPGSSHGNEDSPKSPTIIIDDDDDEWLFSDSSSEEGDDDGNPVDEIPKASCDHDEQTYLLYVDPRTKLHELTPTRLFPAYKTGNNHVFYDDYNLGDTTEVSVSNVAGCLNERQCRCYSMILLQFIGAKIAGYQPNCPGRAEIYGFVAARDYIEPLRNYVYMRDNKNCEAVSVKRKMGMARLSLTSPTRVISMTSRAFIEFELHDRNESETNGNDGLIIEGCTELYNMFESKSFIEHRRLHGERCALDIKYMVLMSAVEAQVKVKVLRLGAIVGGVNMKLYAKPSGLREVICLFQGAAPEQGTMMSFTLAVERRSGLELYMEGFRRDESEIGEKPLPHSWWHCGFASSYHRTDEEVAELGEFAAVSIKITWKSYLKSGGG